MRRRALWGWSDRLSRTLFDGVHVEPGAPERARGLVAKGAVVYVLRHESRADTLLAKWVIRRDGFPVPEVLMEPSRVGRILRRAIQRARDWLSRSPPAGGSSPEQAAEEVARQGGCALVFLSARRRHTTEADRALAALVRVTQSEGREVSVVPLAPVRGRGYRRRVSTAPTSVYSVRDVPGEIQKLATYFFSRRDLSLKVGAAVSVKELVERYPGAASLDVARRLSRVLRLSLRREERVVWGPPLVAKKEIREIVLRAPRIRQAVEEVARERGVVAEKVWREARNVFDEMAANFNGFYFSILKFAFYPIWNRMFRGLEVSGLERIADAVRRDSVVLVPCHRSHFDYLILTYIFHSNFLSPPHIAAGINLSFFPMGMLFRGAGAFFIRRTFAGDPVYREVFREYLTYLLREGYTQEFFIEGGRSRTGKIMTPKLGMLSAIVDAAHGGVARDVVLVPVSIHYERLVEEEAYKAELLGGAKERETFGALLRARTVLARNYGRVHVSFAEPISLRNELAGLRPESGDGFDDDLLRERRKRFTVKLGFRLLADVNRVAVIGGPSIVATVLLGSRTSGITYEELRAEAAELVEYAESTGASFAPSLVRDRETFRETLGFLEGRGLVQRISIEGGPEVISVPEDRRLNLDFYKNNSIHRFVTLGLVTECRARGCAERDLEREVWWWLGLFRNEFVIPERGEIGREIERIHAWLDGREARSEGQLIATHPLARATADLLQSFREAYWVAARGVTSVEVEGVAEKAAISRMLEIHRAHRLLGRLAKPEGSITVTLRNAIDRYAELGLVRVERRGRGARERWIHPGGRPEDLARVEEHIGKSLFRADERGNDLDVLALR